MDKLRIRATEGGTASIDGDTLTAFASGLRGKVLQERDPGYDQARALWNGMIDRRPALIVRCAGAADVMRSVEFARDHGVLVSVRGGGHNIAGKAACDAGMMIDLSPMNWVRVNPRERTALVGPGATLGDFDRETQAFALTTPVGINSTTGIAGLTLGGGFGWLSRKYGLTLDNLVSADVVTADGQLRTVSEKQEPELFWGVRGGGGNLGVVTAFEFRLHPFGPEVLSGLVVHRFADAPKVFEHYRRFTAEAPDDLTCWVVLRKAPPLPFLPPEVHGTEVMVVPMVYAGDMKKGEALMRPMRQFGNPLADMVMPHPWVGFQQAFDPLLTPGARNYWKSNNFRQLSDGVVQALLRAAGRLPSPHCEVFMGHLGAAVNRVAPDATAYPHRDAEFVLNVHARWETPQEDKACIQWARDLHEDTKPFATGGVYVNFISEGDELVQGAYGINFERLARLKAKYDPQNLFRLNQNVQPVRG